MRRISSSIRVVSMGWAEVVLVGMAIALLSRGAVRPGVLVYPLL
jgi:hypothetical protein